MGLQPSPFQKFPNPSHPVLSGYFASSGPLARYPTSSSSHWPHGGGKWAAERGFCKWLSRKGLWTPVLPEEPLTAAKIMRSGNQVKGWRGVSSWSRCCCSVSIRTEHRRSDKSNSVDMVIGDRHESCLCGLVGVKPGSVGAYERNWE